MIVVMDMWVEVVVDIWTRMGTVSSRREGYRGLEEDTAR